MVQLVCIVDVESLQVRSQGPEIEVPKFLVPDRESLLGWAKFCLMNEGWLLVCFVKFLGQAYGCIRKIQRL